MTSNYKPPYTLTAEIVNLVAEIAAAVERLTFMKEPNLRLRKINRIKTIQGSLAIEGNTLDTEQITAILEGKPVMGTMREIQEVKNAIETYNNFENWDPYKVNDLLEAHQMLMKGLIDEAGKFRSSGVGVFSGDKIIHLAPPAQNVRGLMNDLLHWAGSTNTHPLIASAVFHYEFEFIHPFSDGNGRMGRLWQTLLLKRWNNWLGFLPVENLIYQEQAAYYNALQAATKATDCAPFITYILERILAAMASVTPEVKPLVTPEVERLLDILIKHSELSRSQLQQLLQLKDEKNMRLRYISPALKNGWIELTVPDKPNSRLQKYRITEKGRGIIL
jgi:Fic family protein